MFCDYISALVVALFYQCDCQCSIRTHKSIINFQVTLIKLSAQFLSPLLRWPLHGITATLLNDWTLAPIDNRSGLAAIGT